MALFTLYTYQFSPILNFNHDQIDLFGKVYIQSAIDSMENKNKIFEKSLIKSKYRHLGKDLSTQLIINDNNLIIFRIANKKNIKLEKNFHPEVFTNEPSILIVVNNDKEVQRIAIEQNTSIFSDTSVVAGIISKSLKESLKENNLSISIKREFKETEFWEVVNRHKDGIRMVRFQFDYPNLPRSCSRASEMLKSISKVINGKSSKAEFQAAEGEVLELENDNDGLNDLIKESANTGNYITFGIKGTNKHLKTGNTIKTLDIDVSGKTDDIENIKSLLETFRSIMNDV